MTLQGVCFWYKKVIYRMKNLKNLIDLDKYKVAKSILSTAGKLGKNENIEVYVVGGFVRDLLMDK